MLLRLKAHYIAGYVTQIALFMAPVLLIDQKADA